jgi:hypothetical protein
VTERRGLVVNTTASYSEGARSNVGRRPATLTEDFRGVTQSLQASVGIIP